LRTAINRLIVPPSTGRRLPGIEGLRALAAGSIVLYHVWLWGAPRSQAFKLGGFYHFFRQLPLGVTLFFTLSGFLLYRPFAAAILRSEPRPAFRSYFRNRALRILPAYWFVLLAAGLILETALVRFDGVGSLWSHPGLLIRDAFFVENYSRPSMLTGIGPAWSLAIEVVFYLALPLLVVGAAFLASRASTRSGRRVAALAPALATFLVGLSGKVVATLMVRGLGPGFGWVDDWHSVLERSFWVQADLFTFGMALAVLHVDVQDGIVRLPSWWRKATVAGLVGIAVPTMTLLETRRIGQYPYDTLMALACALLLALVVLPGAREEEPAGFTRFLEGRAFIATGVISYSLFLWHEPLTRWLANHGWTLGGVGGFFLALGEVAVISWLFAILTYQLIERPALLRKARRSVPTPGLPNSHPASSPAT